MQAQIHEQIRLAGQGQSNDTEKLQLAVAEQALTVADQQLEYQQRHKNQVEEQLAVLKDSRDTSQLKMQQALRVVDHATAETATVQRLCQPETSSLLAELRAKQPLWFESLGRIIRPELLESNNLSPSYHAALDAEKPIHGKMHGDMGLDMDVDAATRIFAWQLDYLKIPKPEWASSLSDQQANLLLKEESQRLAEADKNSCELNAVADLKAWQAMHMEKESILRKLKNAVRDKQAAAEALMVIKQSSQDALASRKARALAEQSRLENQRDTLKATQQHELVLSDERYQAQIDEQMGLAHTEISRLEVVARGFAEAIEQAQVQYDQLQKTFQADYKALCSEQGVDEALIDSAHQELQRTKQIFDQVRGYQASVEDYARWLANRWAVKHQLTQAVSSSQAKLQQVEQTLQESRSGYQNQRKVSQAAFDVLAMSRDAAAKNKQQAKDCRLQINRPATAIELTISRPLDMMLASCNGLLESQRQLRQAINEGVGKADSIISRAGEDNQIAAAWTYLRNEQKKKMVDADNTDALNVNLTLALETLLDKQLPQKREALSAFVENVGGQLADFYQGLKQVSDAIARQSRRISDSISSTMHFDAISDIRVALISRIDTQEYWPRLAEFYQAWLAWKAEASLDLPPKTLDAHLVTTTEILHHSTISTGIASVFDLEISLRENDRPETVTRTADLENVSSTGLSYLILCTIFAGITRMLCPDRSINLHWPMDELGTLAAENISRLFVMLKQHNILMLGGFPTTDPLLLQHFVHHHEVKKDVGIIELSLASDALSKLLRRRDKTTQPSFSAPYLASPSKAPSNKIRNSLDD